jgi:hypothetical protein
METVREHLARRIGITAPQYSVVMAIAQLQGESGVSAARLPRSARPAPHRKRNRKARTSGTGDCRQNPKDRRGVLLS